MNITSTAQQLLACHAGGHYIDWQDIGAIDRQDAYRIQNETVRHLGEIGAWKVGCKGPGLEPTCAPLPTQGLLLAGDNSRVILRGRPWRLRGMEVELALRLKQDFDPGDRLPETAELYQAFDAVLPLIEVVESRLAEFPCPEPLIQLADLQSHGALVMGAAIPLPALETLDLRMLSAQLSFNGAKVADTVGGNPAGDLWSMLAWLARHCAQRGMPLKKGQIVTTGSCTGMLFAPIGAEVDACLQGIGDVSLAFA